MSILDFQNFQYGVAHSAILACKIFYLLNYKTVLNQEQTDHILTLTLTHDLQFQSRESR